MEHFKQVNEMNNDIKQIETITDLYNSDILEMIEDTEPDYLAGYEETETVKKIVHQYI